MISSVFALKEHSSVPSNLVNIRETMLEEGYYTNTTLKFLLETHENLLSCKQDFYRAVMESNDDPYVINESFNEIIVKIKDIIKKILAYIDTLVKRFTTQLAKFMGSDKYILKRKDDIKKFPSNVSFTIQGYEYTIDDKIPVIDITVLDLSKISSELDALQDKSPEVKNAKLSAIIADLSDEKMDKICSEILGLNYPVSQTSFANEVFSVFRDGKSSESSITIKRDYVLKVLDDYASYDSKIKNIKALQNNINSKYKTLTTQVDSIIKNNTNLDGQESDVTLNNLVIKLINEIQTIANLHTQAIAAKLDAYNSLILQDKNILYRALDIVQKDINNSKIMKESLDLTINETSYDYTRDITFRSYYTQKFEMDLRQKHFMEECLALSESNIPELKAIHEDLKMDKKNWFQKIIEFVKDIFNKFLMKINKFITNNKQFLEKYKDIILTKKVEEYKLNNMPKYEEGIKNILNHKLPELNIDAIKSKSELQIQQEILDKYDGNVTFGEFAKQYFLCNNTKNDEEVSSTTLNMAELYNFCVSAPNTIKQLEADKTKFESVANKIKSAVLAATPKNESVNLYGEKYYYSSVLESFINEDGEKTAEIKSDNATGNAETKADLNLTPDKNDTPSEKNKDNAEKVKQDEPKDTSKDQAEANKNGDYKKIEETATWYLNALKTASAAKITAYQRIYSEYMKILRYHVSKATGSLGNATKFSKEQTDSIRAAMKEYKDAKDAAAKEAAANKIISIYKSNQMVIDAHDVENLVSKNASKL